MKGSFRGISLTAALFCALASAAASAGAAAARPKSPAPSAAVQDISDKATRPDAGHSHKSTTKRLKPKNRVGPQVGPQVGKQVGKQIGAEMFSGFVESFDPEKNIIMVRLNDEQLQKITKRPAYRHYFSTAGMPSAKKFKLTVKIYDETKIKANPELQGTLFALQKGAAVDILGLLRLDDPDERPNEAFEMDAETVTLAAIACTPGRCLQAGHCPGKCNNNNCKCKKK